MITIKKDHEIEASTNTNKSLDEIRKASPLSKSKHVPFLGGGTFDVLYSSFTCLAEITRIEGNEVVINRKGNAKKPEQTPLTRDIEKGLYEFSKDKNYQGMELKVSYYYSQYSTVLDDSLKYIILFYKVSLCL